MAVIWEKSELDIYRYVNLLFMFGIYLSGGDRVVVVFLREVKCISSNDNTLRVVKQ